MSPSPRLTAALVILLAIHSSTLTAATFNWTGSGSNDAWNTPANWSPSGTPGSNDLVQIFSTTGSQVSLNGDRQIAFLNFNAAGNFSILSNTLTLQAGQLSTDGTGTLTIGSNLASPSPNLNLNVGTGGLVINGVLSGGFNLLKGGTGTLTLGNANTFSGNLLLNQGTIRLNNANALQNNVATISVANGLNLNGLNANLGGLSGTGNLDLGAATLTVGQRGVATSYSGVLSGSGSLVKTGVATQILSANNTFTGSTTISGGILEIGNGGTTGALAGDVVNNAILRFNRSDASTHAGLISGTGSLEKQAAGVLTLSNANTFTGPTTINGGQIRLGHANALQNSTVAIEVANGLDLNNLNANLGALSGSGDLQLGTATVSVGQNNATTSYSGILSGTGNLTKTGTGTLTLGGANTFTGQTTLTAGQVTLNHANALQNSTVLFTNTSGTLNLNGLNANLGALRSTSATAPTLTIGTNTVSVGENNASTNYNGFITGTGTFVKSGTGTLTLSAAKTEFFGSTHVNAGTLALSHFFTLASSTVTLGSAGTLTFASSGEIGGLAGSGTVSAPVSQISIGRNGTSNSYSGTITGGAGVSKIGAGTWTLSGTDQINGDFAIQTGQVRLTNADALRLANTALFVNNTLDINGLNASLGGLGGSGNLALGSNTLTVGAKNSNISYFGTLSGTGSVVKVGTGRQEFLANMTYTGNTTVQGGILSLGANSSNGAIAGNVTIGSQGTLRFNRTTAHTYAGLISGNGTVQKSGNNTLTLTGNSTAFAGTLQIQSGKVVLERSLGTGNIVITGGELGGNGSTSGSLTLTGGTLSPGNSIGTILTGSQIWTNGSLELEINTDGDTGEPGTAWDAISINGELDLSTLNSITLALATLIDQSTPGPLGTWDPAADHVWGGVVSTTDGITGFESGDFVVDTTAFQNPIDGEFSVQINGDQLDLHYQAVPEPSSAALIALGFAICFGVRRRR